MKSDTRGGRSAFSLIEMLLAITFGSVVMTLAVGLVHSGLVNQAATKSRVEQSSRLNRFAEQFRSDVHMAREIKSSNGGLTLVTWQGDSIQYSAPGSRLERERIIEVSRQVETIDLAQDQSVAFACSDDGKSCSLEIQFHTQDATTRTLRRVVVAVGLNCTSPPPVAVAAGDTQ